MHTKQPKGRTKLVAAIAVATVLLALLGWRVSVGQQVMRWAIRGERPVVARSLLRLGLNPNGEPGKWYVPLFDSASACRPEFVRILLESGAKPEAGDAFGYTPLRAIDDSCQAAETIIDMLAKAGANFRVCAKDEPSVLSTVSLGPKVATALLRHGADPDQTCPGNYGYTPLHYHVEEPEVVALLLEHGAKIVAGESDRQTPLHEAADRGRKDYEAQIPSRLKTAELLLAHGAEVNAEDSRGRTALDLAYERGDKEMAAILVKHGGKANKYDSLEAGEAARDEKDEYRELYSVAEGVRKGPACTLGLHGEKRAIMEEGPNWSIVQGTEGVVRVNCHTSGFFHYAVLGMGSPVPKRLNMPLSSGLTTQRITFDAPWNNGMMHFYYSAEPITSLVRAINRGDATHFALRYVNVGK